MVVVDSHTGEDNSTTGSVFGEVTTTSTTTKGKTRKCRDAEDIVIVIDGSWSVGVSDFRKIKEFIGLLLRSFSIKTRGDGGVHLGVVQYSNDPRAEFLLNDHLTREALNAAITNIAYKGGNTATGRALDFVRNHMFASLHGAREDVKRKAIIITDGASVLDDPRSPAKLLRHSNVEVFTIGVGEGADKAELERISSHPTNEHTMMIKDFDHMIHIKKKFIKKFCPQKMVTSSSSPTSSTTTTEETTTRR